MKKIRISLFVLLAAALAFELAAAPPQGKPAKPESIVEATADGVLLPSTPNGILVVRACASCPPSSYRASVATVYTLNGEVVTLAQLQRLLPKLPHTNINIGIKPETGELLVVDAVDQLAKPMGSKSK